MSDKQAHKFVWLEGDLEITPPPPNPTTPLNERLAAFQRLHERFQQVSAYQRNVQGKTVDVRAYTRDVDVNSIDSGPRIFRGEPVKSTKISKSRTGKIGEALTLHQKGGMPLNTFLGLKQNNLPFDVVNLRTRTIYEVKAGLISVGYGAKNKYDGMKWRLTKGEPGKAEKKLLRRMAPDIKRLYNEGKESRILARKLNMQREVEKRTGLKFQVKTITYIINPDTKQADMYEFEGLHPVIRWRSDEASAGYKRSLKWK